MITISSYFILSRTFFSFKRFRILIGFFFLTPFSYFFVLVSSHFFLSNYSTFFSYNLVTERKIYKSYFFSEMKKVIIIILDINNQCDLIWPSLETMENKPILIMKPKPRVGHLVHSVHFDLLNILVAIGTLVAIRTYVAIWTFVAIGIFVAIWTLNTTIFNQFV